MFVDMCLWLLFVFPYGRVELYIVFKMFSFQNLDQYHGQKSGQKPDKKSDQKNDVKLCFELL